jgi:tetraacyldisaccharide 4'-kinase
MNAPPWRTRLRQAWQQRSGLACLLWPLSWVYGALVRRRLAQYRQGKRQTVRLPVPVIVVGNVVAGGVGKTPLVIALVQLCQQFGWAVGVVSRGYGRTDTAIRPVTAQSLSQDVGDEPLLIARTTGAPVWVGADRCAAAQALLQQHPHTRLIISDDGLQHLRLHRDLELCVFDERGVGNGWLLPAGPLREPWPRTTDAQTPCLVVHTGSAGNDQPYHVNRQLATHARRADGTQRPLVHWQDKPVQALAGIAKPENFFAALQAEGLLLQRCLSLPDHDDMQTVALDLTQGDVLCTEKDAVKLWPRYPGVWAVPLRTELSRDLRLYLEDWLVAATRRTP